MKKRINPQPLKLFVNPNGVLCLTCVYYTRCWTIIDVYPVIDGYDINGNLINPNDYHYKSHGKC